MNRANEPVADVTPDYEARSGRNLRKLDAVGPSAGEGPAPGVQSTK